MKFSEHFSDILENQYSTLFPKGEKVLGVASRGTDMIGFPGHSIQPTKEQLLERTIGKMNDYGYEYVFLATEEDSVVEYFKSNLGAKKVITDSGKRYDEYASSGKYVLSDMHFGRKDEKRLQGEEYLLTVSLLAKCDALMGTIVGKTVGAICINGGKYEHIDIIDLGRY